MKAYHAFIFLFIFSTASVNAAEKKFILGDFPPGSSKMMSLGEKVGDVIDQFSSIQKITIYGASDSSGDPEKNLDLARGRADVCVTAFQDRFPNITIQNGGALSDNDNVNVGINARVCVVKIEYSGTAPEIKFVPPGFINRICNIVLHQFTDRELILLTILVVIFLSIVISALFRCCFRKKKCISKKTHQSKTADEKRVDSGDERILCDRCGDFIMRKNMKRHQKRCSNRKKPEADNEE